MEAVIEPAITADQAAERLAPFDSALSGRAAGSRRGDRATDRPDAVADVLIIGAGVVGTAIARTLARYQLSCVLVDAANDVGTGTSKANTAILHTGFDAVPGSLESRLLRRGSALLADYARQAGHPGGADRRAAGRLDRRSRRPRCPRSRTRPGATASPTLRRIAAAPSCTRREPHLGPGALGAW